ncbi:MAG: tripartite tricarboxylate transporter substrate binding protein [Burkholderiaceae bacterium]|nr:tripartite tricarboxylate transporter substrate binding protein [Burkholderiaceae bacterium]
MKKLAGLVRILATASLLSPFVVNAETWPSKPIRILVPYAAGGVLDSLVRPMAEKLGQKLGQAVIVDNQAGAGGNIGMAACSRAAPDGYTLCATTNDSISFNPFLYKKMAYDPSTDLAAVQRLVTIDALVVTGAQTGIKTFSEFESKAKTGNLNWGSWGIGSAAHLYVSAINSAKGTNILHVPYKGSGPVLQGLLGGEVNSSVLAIGMASQYVKAGKLTPIAVASEHRLPDLPNVPTVKEVGVPFIPVWFGLFAPSQTPSDIVQRVNKATAEVLSDPKFAADVLKPSGFTAAPLTPAQYDAFLKEDRVNGQKMVKLSGATLD